MTLSLGRPWWLFADRKGNENEWKESPGSPLLQYRPSSDLEQLTPTVWASVSSSGK